MKTLALGLGLLLLAACNGDPNAMEGVDNLDPADIEAQVDEETVGLDMEGPGPSEM